jgi:hypothetical protein
MIIYSNVRDVSPNGILIRTEIALQYAVRASTGYGDVSHYKPCEIRIYHNLQCLHSRLAMSAERSSRCHGIDILAYFSSWVKNVVASNYLPKTITGIELFLRVTRLVSDTLSYHHLSLPLNLLLLSSGLNSQALPVLVGCEAAKACSLASGGCGHKTSSGQLIWRVR